MQQLELEKRLVRYGDLIPCKTAFIDAHTPGSNEKENFTIIGGGVSESPNQHVHIKLSHGFNIGAAGQTPKCKNSLHSHKTAEVFFVLSGRWRFFWGRWGTAGEVTLEEGDIINIPTGIFRGFENIGTDYAMIMAILGGDDAGGGVIWAPQVIEEAENHGLILSEEGKLYNTKKGEKLPPRIKPIQPLSTSELKNYPELSAEEVIPNHVARYLDLKALAFKKPAKVIGEFGKLIDKPGFEVDFLTRTSVKTSNYVSQKNVVLMPVKGHWRIDWSDGYLSINPGDTLSVPENFEYQLKPSMTGESAIYRIEATSDPAGPTWNRKK